MDIAYRAPDSLRPHPLNERIYAGDPDAEELRASVAAHGVLTPITIDQDGTIISGHRRWQAARSAGLAAVPVVVRPVADPLEAEQLLIESNRQREKTYTERMREADHLTRIEAGRARQRQQGGRGGVLLPATLPGATGETREKVAEAIGMKARTYVKVRHVHDAANDETIAESIRATAQQLMAALDAGETTPNAAEKALREAETRHEVQGLMDTLATEGLLDPPGTQAAWDRLQSLVPSLDEAGRHLVADFAARMELQTYALKAHLVAEHVKRAGPGGLAATAAAFGISRRTVAGLLILHQEAQGGVRFRPTGLELDNGLPYGRFLEIGHTLESLTEAEATIEDEQLLDECRGLIRRMVRAAA